MKMQIYDDADIKKFLCFVTQLHDVRVNFDALLLIASH